MNRSDQIDQIAAAMARAQGQIRGAVKDANNTYHKSRYADLASVWEACREALSANGLAVLQPVRWEPIEPRPAAPGEDPWPSARTILVTILTHESGQWLAGELPLPDTLRTPQQVGSGLTYARRYALAAMVGVAPEDDDGEAAMGRGPGQRQQQQQEPRPRGRDVGTRTRPARAGGPARMPDVREGPPPARTETPTPPAAIDPRSFPKLIADLVGDAGRAWVKEHPDVPEVLNAYQVERHMLKEAVEREHLADPGEVKQGDVRRILAGLYDLASDGARPHYKWMRKELKGYIDRQYDRARAVNGLGDDAAGVTSAGDGVGLSPEPGMRG